MTKFRGAILLIAAGLAIYYAIVVLHGWRAIITAILGVIVGIVGVLRLKQKRL
jgi:hypothetical protein